MIVFLILTEIYIYFYRLVHSSNEFTFEKRTPDCLPRDFPTQPGDTCYFLNVANQMKMLEDRKL